eukprot:CAMPEP_0183353640 /NCGR_PEP_ID=MMETSP0164_2-20130417/34228_1 /TAXON_ID=221442 /ORGANISM="Coccolithus pelagicus ssp braarudi, Strain PLY182g" /LENGTH=213 /DNA_ID=CAMNT_0025526343 /DNA_START=74 /DNA_END=715 /DNA_ORIENTATION=-
MKTWAVLAILGLLAVAVVAKTPAKSDDDSDALIDIERDALPENDNPIFEEMDADVEDTDDMSDALGATDDAEDEAMDETEDEDEDDEEPAKEAPKGEHLPEAALPGEVSKTDLTDAEVDTVARNVLQGARASKCGGKGEYCDLKVVKEPVKDEAEEEDEKVKEETEGKEGGEKKEEKELSGDAASVEKKLEKAADEKAAKDEKDAEKKAAEKK